jgi:molecular chaperone DnaK (HSP70)
MSKEIGIDLGTTYSCVGVYENNKVIIIANNSGEYTIPSVVSFLDNGSTLIGRPAKNNLIRNYKNTIYNTKRLIGRKYNDKEVQYEKQHSSFKIIEEEDIKCPFIEIENKNKKKQYFYPQEISTMILQQLKKIAEDYLNTEVTDAVITVPAYFNELQRQVTKDAGRIAGLNVLRIINEPTAAAIAYGLQNNNLKNKNVLIFDFGGGTFDVSVLSISNEGIIIIKSTCGDSHLGGEDIDNRLKDKCIEIFKQETGIDISNDLRANIRLKLECEKRKIQLSSCEYTLIEINNIINGKDMKINIKREEFNEWCNDIFLRCFECVRKALEYANLKRDDIEDIVLVGGSSHIPKIEELVKGYFNREKLLSTIKINPSEAVAYGASYLANVIKGKIKDENVVLVDIIGISIGIGIYGGKMQIIIPKGTSIPTSNKVTTYTHYDNQTSINICIYQGEDIDNVNNNFFIKELLIDNIEKAPAGEVKFEMILNIDVNSCLSIEIKDLKTQKLIKNYKLTDQYSKNYEKQVLQMLENIQKINKKKLIESNYKDYKEELINLCLSERNEGNQKAEILMNMILDDEYPIYIDKYESYLNALNEK